jgi:hypothetical protein
MGWAEKQQVPFEFAQGRLSTPLRSGPDDNSREKSIKSQPLRKTIQWKL